MPKNASYFTLDLSMSPEDRLKSMWNELANDTEEDVYFDKDSWKHIKFLSAHVDAETGSARAEFELTIAESLCSRFGTLHGGAACTVLDNVTSATLRCLAKPGFLDGGHVSRTITMSYLRPVPAGSSVKVECTVVAVGKATANVLGVIKTADGKVCVTCTHDKAVLNQNRKGTTTTPML